MLPDTIHVPVSLHEINMLLTMRHAYDQIHHRDRLLKKELFVEFVLSKDDLILSDEILFVEAPRSLAFQPRLLVQDRRESRALDSALFLLVHALRRWWHTNHLRHGSLPKKCPPMYH